MIWTCPYGDCYADLTDTEDGLRCPDHGVIPAERLDEMAERAAGAFDPDWTGDL